MKHSFTLIHWYGPFELSEVIESDWGKESGLYLFTGKQKDETESQIQYCGISEQSYASRFKTHHKHWKIDSEREVWLGIIESTPYPHMNGAYLAYLKEPERLLTYYLQAPLNEKNRILKPRPMTVINYWFTKDKELRRKNVHVAQQGMHRVISWDGENWHLGDLKIVSDEEE